MPMPMIKYGKVTIHEGYKNGEVVNRLQRVEQSVPIKSRQELLDNIFDQLKQLQEHDSVSFTIYADKHTHEPVRMVLVSEAEL